MVTRQTIIQDPNNPKPHLETGYDIPNSPPEDGYTIPPCGIEDVDVALHQLFDIELGFTNKPVNGRHGPIFIRKPSVIFAVGERFAIVKKLRPVRDQNNSLMLPSISIRRTSIDQTSEDIVGRGINQMTGEIVIKKRLDPSDRDYQNIVNKFLFKNMGTLMPSTRRLTGIEKDDSGISQGAYLDSKLGNNIFEIISVPQPQYFTATYEVVFWTSYTEHMNYLIETLFSSFLPQGRMFKLTTPKGYWFIAYVDDSLSSQENVDDFTEEERIIRYSFTMRVKGYIFAINGPGHAVPIKRTLSAPNIVFDTIEVNNQVHTKKHVESINTHDKFSLTDLDINPETQQTPTTLERYVLKKDIINPVRGTKEFKYVSLSDYKKIKGETVYTASDQETLMQFLFQNKGT